MNSRTKTRIVDIKRKPKAKAEAPVKSQLKAIEIRDETIDIVPILVNVLKMNQEHAEYIASLENLPQANTPAFLYVVQEIDAGLKENTTLTKTILSSNDDIELLLKQLPHIQRLDLERTIDVESDFEKVRGTIKAKTCRKCGGNEWFTSELQLGSGDEGTFTRDICVTCAE